jgi:dephospho-CoA kinase
MSSPQSRPRGSERLTIGFAGRIGAGKTSAAKFLEREYGFQYVRYSEVLADWLRVDPAEKGRLQAAGWEVMAGGLQTELNRKLIGRLEPARDHTVDGLRHLIDYETLKNGFGASFFLIYLDCPSELRWERLKVRNRYRARQDFDAADASPVEQHIEKLRPKATVTIQNSGTLGDLYVEMNNTLERIRSGEPL